MNVLILKLLNAKLLLILFFILMIILGKLSNCLIWYVLKLILTKYNGSYDFYIKKGEVCLFQTINSIN